MTGTLASTRPAFDRVRIYEIVRTAHLERAHTFVPATILFSHRRYDFDAELAHGLDLIECSLPGMVLSLLRRPVRAIEVNEPLMRSGLPRAAAAIAAVRLRGRISRSTPLVVSYAIANLNGFSRPAKSLRARVRRILDRSLARYVTRHVDRLAFGTDAAQALYQDFLGTELDRVEQAVIPAVSAACTCPEFPTVPGSVLFLGALDDRKGILHLLDAWPRIRREHPGAQLVIIGTGTLAPTIAGFAEENRDVVFIMDPPRDVIHLELRRAATLVLPSVRTPLWREQVGLPIVEALAHGCSVVTTTETGLSDWLETHGHRVIDSDKVQASDLAATVVQTLEENRPSASVLADLPLVDGRQQADEWLFSDPISGSES